MKYQFWKYQGTGNDFIFFDGREDVSVIKDNKEVIARLCHRRYGIGADGLIILEKHETSDFRMVYYNSDGGESTMCGNGGRCSISFAHFMGLAGEKTNFQAIDGLHSGEIANEGWIKLGMNDVSDMKRLDERTYLLNTGSPHYVRLLDQGEDIDIVAFGREIRYSAPFAQEGINVNVVQEMDGKIKVKTYERGVEDETYSCGTGVTAAAIVYHRSMNNLPVGDIDVMTKGGALKVSFNAHKNRYTNIVLHGPVQMVFTGQIEI
ncbi:diaminopimelate epimerase [Portibacter marinus]|uniref:diaminopimelate epimerase n=1 Tax=Portibacter marinus TaxID=2898660 RepID=UPI001F1D9193|nr:diaminopimelate epimerase [Portibacter marinus]